MRYTKRELRNTHMPLLRRLQRKIDKKNENKLQVQPTDDEGLKILGLETIEEKILTKPTKLHLYRKRRRG